MAAAVISAPVTNFVKPLGEAPLASKVPRSSRVSKQDLGLGGNPNRPQPEAKKAGKQQTPPKVAVKKTEVIKKRAGTPPPKPKKAAAQNKAPEAQNNSKKPAEETKAGKPGKGKPGKK